MKTILATSQKGGSGKTTLVGLLSVEASRTEASPAWIIDTDPQATLTKWHSRREQDIPHRAELPFQKIAEGLRTIAERDAPYCFIDTAPTISDQSAALIALADLVLIPIRPSPADLWASAETVALVKDAGKPFLFIITQAKPQATITAQTIAALSQHGRVAQSFIADRVVYASAMTGGFTAPEISPKSPAAEEVARLWLDVKSCFHENSNSDRSLRYG